MILPPLVFPVFTVSHFHPCLTFESKAGAYKGGASLVLKGMDAKVGQGDRAKR
jgi:hypothetical protein